MTTNSLLDPNVQKWGFRSAWLPAAWATDTQHVERWFRLTTFARSGGSEMELFTRVLGWDSSPLPTWVKPQCTDRVRVDCCEVTLSSPQELLSPGELQEFAKGRREARRVQLSVQDWHSEYDATAWALGVPTVAYELWPSASSYADSLELWQKLEHTERQAVGLPREWQGYLSSLVVLIPRIASFFCGPHHFVIAGDQQLARSFAVYDETHDGLVTLGRVASALLPQPWPKEFSCRELPLEYVRLYYREPTLSALGQPLPEATSEVFRVPRCHHGLSGSDSTVGVVSQTGTVDICRIGLIRGLGQGYFTSEPWRERAASLGFSAPARVIHVPPNSEAADAAFIELASQGKPGSFSIADPYADAPQLERFQDKLRGARVITRSKSAKNITAEWMSRNSVQVRTVSSLHDRFVIGSRSAALIGSSLSGLGQKHSFIVLVDAVMQSELASVFEDLWKHATQL